MGLTHGADERVVFLDGSEALVPIDPVRLHTAYNYKAVTTNQDVVDAAVNAFTWNGGTVRPLAPVNLRGVRNDAGDLLITWTRRSRLGYGFRPGSDVPLGEEVETYLVEIYSGSTLLRTIQVWVDQGQMVVWEFYGGTPSVPVISGDGTVTFSGGAATLRSRQVVGPDFLLEFTVPNTATYSVPQISLIRNFITAGQEFWGVDSLTTTLARLEKLQNLTVATGDRITIEARGGVVSYYKNYSGPTSSPVYVSALSPIQQAARYNLWITQVGTSEARTIRLFRYQPETFYTAAQQTQDFGSTQSSIRVRVKQISSIVGPGAYVEGTL